MPRFWDHKIILQHTAERIAATTRMCDASDQGEIYVTHHIITSRQAVAHSKALLVRANRQLC